MATPRFVGATSGFIPEATGQAIAFVRDEKKFKINDYVQFISTPTPVGLYAYLDPDAQVRVVTDEEFAWQDGDKPPEGNANLANFKWEEFRTMRRAIPYSIGEQAMEASKGWPVKAFHNAMILSQAMTLKTKRVVDLIESTSSWGTSNYADADTLNDGAGTWDAATGSDDGDPNYLAIRKTLNEACRRINLMTNGMVGTADLRLVISPGLAIKMSVTGEINEFLKNNQFALAQVKGNAEGQNALWGLPDMYAGVKIIVEDASRVSVRPKAAGTPAVLDTEKAYIKADNSAVLLSRVGGLDGNYGAPSFSTVQLYYYKYQLAVETEFSSWEKRHNARVVDNYKEILAAPPAGFLIRNVL